MKNLQSAATLANGVEMPWLGLGVYKVQEGQEVIDSVKAAIRAGYKSTNHWQVMIRWDLQNGIISIPKSVREHRIIENAEVFDFELSASEIEQINGLNQNRRFGADPDHFNF